MNFLNPATSSSGTPSSSVQTRLSPDDAALALRAAHYAVAAYPGPLGELISWALRNYVNVGEDIQAPALLARLILALEQSEAQHPLPPVRSGWGHLPAQYIPGSPTHWRYRTTADDAGKPDAGSQ
jgi:hypothetical protein